MVALVDCNNFYASCEKVFEPSLLHKPVVVLSNNDGCIISRSQEAKNLGIKMGGPYFKEAKMLKENGVEVFSSNYTLYGDMSSRMIETIRSITDEVEIYSIDEAFTGLSMVPEDKLWETSQTMRDRIFQWTGLPVKVGIGPTKTLAKVAAEYAKTKGNGKTHCAYTKNDIEEMLKDTPIGEVWGVGRGFGNLLKRYGVDSAWDFSKMPDPWIQQKMGVVGLRIATELRGESCLSLELMREKRRHIMTSRSFGRPVKDYTDMKEAVISYLSRCAEKLREDKQMASMVTVYIRTYPQHGPEAQNNNSQNIMLPYPTDYTPELAKHTLIALDRIFKSGYTYKKAGVLLSELSSKENKQLPLFESVDFNRSSKLMQAMDQINQKNGDRGKLKLAGEGIKQPWKMKGELRSNRFTTHWDELLEVS